MTERIQTPGELPDDDVDVSLRPRMLVDFVGQDSVKTQLATAIEAARLRSEAMDHVLLAGPPGLGKTSLAQIIATELAAQFVPTAGPALERKADVASVLSALEPGAVLFIDEIHRMPRAIEETLYPAMEDRQLPITVGQGAGARIVTLDLPAFTMVGATTQTGLLSRPLRDRFGIQQRLEHYAPGDLAAIVRRSADLLSIDLDEEGAQQIALRSRGTPRVANRLLRRVSDHALVSGSKGIDAGVADSALSALEVDELGLDRLDREILNAVCVTFRGGPVGLTTIAAAISEEPTTLEDVYEPYLLQLGMIERTPRGRTATRRAFEHLGLAPPDVGRLFPE